MCCKIQNAASEFVVNNRKSMDPNAEASIFFTGVRDVILAHFGAPCTKLALLKPHCLLEYCC